MENDQLKRYNKVVLRCPPLSLVLACCKAPGDEPVLVSSSAAPAEACTSSLLFVDRVTCSLALSLRRRPSCDNGTRRRELRLSCQRGPARRELAAEA
eukprot:766562-Hanusia_phi.AAC.4